MAISKKFSLSLDDDSKEIIKLAAERLKVDMAEIVRIGALRFSHLVLDGSLDELMKRDIDK